MPEDEDDVTHVMLAADSDTTVVYEYRRETGGGGGSASIPVTQSESGGESPPVEVSGGGGSGGSATAPESTTAGPKQRVSLPFSGGDRPTFVTLTNEVTTAGGIGHPTNTGSASIGLVAFGPGGEVLSVLNLEPGQTADWFSAPPGATSIAVANREVDNPLGGELTYDLPNS